MGKRRAFAAHNVVRAQKHWTRATLAPTIYNMTMTSHRPQTNGVTAPPTRPAARSSVTGEAANGVQVVFQFDDTDTHADALDTLILANFLNGSQPRARTKRLDQVREEATLLPPGTVATHTAIGDGHDAKLAVGDGWTLRCIRWHSGGALVSVTAVTDELAESILKLAIDGAVGEPEPEDDRVEIGFWHMSGHGPRRRARPIAAALWPEIRANYSPTAATAIDQLVSLDGANLPGRMLLVHGPPGTGKTTALRPLAREWSSWCQLDFVVDPERLFADPGYLIDVVMGSSDDDKPWRLLLLEDCDELVHAGAKQSTGQALSRLLNLTDGLLGQGRQVLVAITTNEDIARLHPAVTRPGRCLAQIEVGPLPRAEACAWLGSSAGIGAAGATLAQLLALRDGTGPVMTPDPPPIGGLYL